MKIHLEREIDKVNTKVLELSAEVERALELATNALLKMDVNAASLPAPLISTHSIWSPKQCEQMARGGRKLSSQLGQ